MKDAKGHGSDSRGSYQNVSTQPLVSNAARDRIAAAHQAGVQDATADRPFGHLAHGETFRFSSERDLPFSGMMKGPWTKTSARGYTHAESGGKYKVGTTKAKVMKA